MRTRSVARCQAQDSLHSVEQHTKLDRVQAIGNFISLAIYFLLLLLLLLLFVRSSYRFLLGNPTGPLYGYGKVLSRGRLQTGFGLVSQFIAHFDIAHDYIRVHRYTHTSVHIHVITARCLVAASNGGHSPSPLGSRTIRVPQLPASNSNSSQGLNRSSTLTHSPTNRLIAPTVLLITSRHGPHNSHSVPLLLYPLLRLRLLRCSRDRYSATA
jgi:hypothetical protein